MTSICDGFLQYCTCSHVWYNDLWVVTSFEIISQYSKLQRWHLLNHKASFCLPLALTSNLSAWFSWSRTQVKSKNDIFCRRHSSNYSSLTFHYNLSDFIDFGSEFKIAFTFIDKNGRSFAAHIWLNCYNNTCNQSQLQEYMYSSSKNFTYRVILLTTGIKI